MQLFLSHRHCQIDDNYNFRRVHHQPLSANYMGEQDSKGYAEDTFLDIHGDLVLSTGIQHHAQVQNVHLY